MSSIDVKSTDGRVFGLWARAECEECDNEFLVTRTVERTVFGKLVCSDCADHEESFKEGEKAGAGKVQAIKDKIHSMPKMKVSHYGGGFIDGAYLSSFIESLDKVES